MRSRSGDHPVVSSVGWWRRWASWAGHAASGAAAAYGCVLLVAALTGYRSFLGVTDLGLPDVTWPGAAVLLVGSVVAAATVRPWGARVPPRAVSGRKHPAPHAAPRVVRRIAYAGCWVFLPYPALHALGAAGVPGIEPGGFRPTWPMVLAGVGGVGLAVFLLLGPVRPWGMVFPRWTPWLAGRRVPRFLPLAPVWVLAPTLALYGTGSGILVGVGVLGDGLFGIGGAASLAFGGYGWALAVAAVSYQHRSRPLCVVTKAAAS